MKYLLLLFLSLSAASLQAQSRFIWELTARAGNFVSSVPEGEKAPTMAQTGLGMSLGIAVIPNIVVGLEAEYQQFSQYSEPTAAIGNRRGTRVYFAPMIGFQSAGWIVRGNYQFIGEYKLKNLSIGGNTDLEFSEPKGQRIEAFRRVTSFLSMGLYYEMVKYAESNFGLSQADVGGSLDTTAIGFVLALRIIGT